MVAEEVNTDVTARTMQSTVQEALNINKHVANYKEELDEKPKGRRVDCSTTMKDCYSEQDNWKHVRFSDEVHCGYGPQGKDLILRKPGTR